MFSTWRAQINAFFPLNACLLIGHFQTGKIQTKAETMEQNMKWQGAKQQAFISRTAGVHRKNSK